MTSLVRAHPHMIMPQILARIVCISCNPPPVTTPYPYALEVPIGTKPPGPDVKQPALQASPLQVYTGVGPSQLQQPTYVISPTVYHYTNPQTNERIASLLPPDHPEMLCLQAGAHVPHTRYGVVGQSPDFAFSTQLKYII